MTFLPARRIRRPAADRQAVIKEKFITFLLDRDWFGVSVLEAFRVVPIGELTGGPQGSGVVFYDGHQVSLINVDKVIFHRSLTRKLQPKALLLIHNAQKQLWGIPLDSPPLLRTIPQDQLQDYATETVQTHHCIRSKALINQTIPLLILNSAELIPS